MFLKWILFLYVLSVIDAQFAKSCQRPRLLHGKARGRPIRKVVRFTCNPGFELVGNRYATCVNGLWDTAPPVCIRPNSLTCVLPTLENGFTVPKNNNGWVMFFCLPGYRLVGSSAIYCDGMQWNATKPSCVADDEPPKLSCDFESPDLCGWTQDTLHDFDWERYNEKTPSSFLSTGPSYDHTYGFGKSGYYMYIESTSRLQNETARLLSPIFDASLTRNGCFVFYYHMFGRNIGGLRVYQKPDSTPLDFMLGLPEDQKKPLLLFDMWGNQGDFWYGSVTELKDLDEDFQIVIEGIRGRDITSDIAIDDVSIEQGESCQNLKNTIPTPLPMIPESCEGRCGQNQTRATRVCGCSFNCIMDGNCCWDYLDLCIYSDIGTTEDSEITTPEPPQTQKLIAKVTTLTDTTMELSKTEKTPDTTVKITTQKPTQRSIPISPTLPPRPTPPSTTTTQSTTTTTQSTPKTTLTPKTTRPAPITTKTTPKPILTTKKVTTTTKVYVTFQKDAISDIPKNVSSEPKTKKFTTRIYTSTAKPKTTKPVNVTVRTTVGVKTTRSSANVNFKGNSTKAVTVRFPANGTLDKENKEMTIQSRSRKSPPTSKSSAWRPVLITLAVVVCVVGAAWAARWARGARGTAAIALLRRRAAGDHEVRYLHADQDDDE